MLAASGWLYCLRLFLTDLKMGVNRLGLIANTKLKRVRVLPGIWSVVCLSCCTTPLMNRAVGVTISGT
jgi:hypothetical protein